MSSLAYVLWRLCNPSTQDKTDQAPYRLLSAVRNENTFDVLM